MDENEIAARVRDLKKNLGVDLAKVASERGVDFANLSDEVKALLIDSAHEGYNSGIYDAS